ncbi:hypothetical protein PRIPAC_97140, partial [Pristionchus pacificus]|uniref:Uncharacterized protein n=1 Tax=Pristionchus pacificus TaxID=54126 RepID=A0A2A6BJU9_PRIPA
MSRRKFRRDELEQIAMFVNWALRSVRESLIQVDPLAAALAYKEREPKRPLPAVVSRTPLLLQFTPFAGPPPGGPSDL